MSRARDTANQINRVNSSAADATAITVDSSENVLVGTTNSNIGSSSTEEGIVLNSASTIAATRSGNVSAVFNRLTTDGDIISLRKNGTSVGSIGYIASGLYIDGEGGHSGLRFGGADISPRDGGADADAAIQLGSSSNRFTDLYLSGGVYLGGTGSANKLDDYEEGTWTPVDYLGNALGLNSGTAGQTYTKIGRQVILNFDVSGTGSTSGAQIRGLPFTAPSSYGNAGNLIQGYAAGGMPANTRGHVYVNALYMYDGSTAVSWTSGRRMVGTIVYMI